MSALEEYVSNHVENCKCELYKVYNPGVCDCGQEQAMKELASLLSVNQRLRESAGILKDVDGK